MNKKVTKKRRSKKVRSKKSNIKQPTIKIVDSIGSKGFHKIAYREWGEPAIPNEPEEKHPVMCLHGLTRNSRDFDTIADQLSEDRRVICPDTAGRGHSDWLRSNTDYNLPQYNLDVAVVAGQANVQNYDIIGTSLGGLMGIILASMDRSPIRRLVVNDIGPEIPMDALQRLSHYVGENPLFETLEETEAYIREKYAPFGPMTDGDWLEMTKYSSYKTEEGYRLAYDPTISENYRRYWLLTYFDIWDYWKAIKCPVMVYRGTESDFLTESVMDKMKEALPHAEFVEYEGVGHTPTLKSKDQIAPIKEFLDR